MSTASPLDVWEAGLPLAPAARAVLMLQAAGEPDVADWSVGHRDAALVRLYCSAPGALAAVAECPSCGTALDVDLDPAVFGAAAFGAAVFGSDTGQRIVIAEHEGYRVAVRTPSAGDLAALAACDPADALGWLFDRCVVSAEKAGDAVAAAELPPSVVAEVETAVAEADPGADLSASMTCTECANRWSEPVDPVRFAWCAVESSATALATEVHTLAASYGWSEPEILELSPFRRHLYLGAVHS